MSTITVFLADDHVVLRDGLQFLLDMQPDLGVVGVADNGRDAVRMVKQLCPDVVILDIAMPEMDGLEAARLIDESCPGAQVIILSMHRTPEHIARALQAGVRGYLLKDSAGDEVIEAVRAVHQGKRYLSGDVSDAVIDYYMHQESLPPNPLDQLTTRERQVLQLLVEGHSAVQIAQALSLDSKTVNTYRRRLMRKLDISHLPGLVKFALKHGLISLE